MRRACLGLLLALWPGPVAAWDSRCLRADGNECPGGSSRALDRWGEVRHEYMRAEHHDLFVSAMITARLPPEELDELRLVPWVEPGARQRPADFRDAGRLTPVDRHVAEFSQLPDFGYSLSDWLDEFDGCPPGAGLDGETCHINATIGFLNSSHFLPQARRFYAHYHDLALDRAIDCRELSRAMSASQRLAFDDFVQECRSEALILEAIGQHFLQDAWSVGHTWERWGSTNFDHFEGETEPEQVYRAAIVGLTAGVIHGIEPILGPLERSSRTLREDPMCHPDERVRFAMPEGDRVAGAGDMHSDKVKLREAYRPQWTRLDLCMANGVADVYELMADPALGWTRPDLERVIPDSDACFGQRATNRALHVGLTTPFAFTDRLLPYVASWRVPGAPPSLAVQVAIGRQYRAEMDQMFTTFSKWAVEDPEGTQLSGPELPDLLGTQPNGKVLESHAVLASADPLPPWAGSSSVAAERLLRGFHRAHAREWCGRVDRGLLESLRSRARPDEPDGAMGLCVELARRHVSYRDEDCPLPTRSLCERLAPGSFVLEVETSFKSDLDLAREWCEGVERKPRDSDGHCDIPVEPDRPGPGFSLGDPHLRSHDGVYYDFQAAGEFVLVRSLAGDLEVQARQQGRAGQVCGGVAINTAAAVRVAGHRVVVRRQVPVALSIDGEPRVLADGESVELGGGARLEQRTGHAWRVIAPDGSEVRLANGMGVSVDVVLAPARAGQVVGLLGDFDGVLEDDLRVGPAGPPIGTFSSEAGGAIVARVDRALLYGAFADAWRVDAATSLFDYAAGEDPETFHIRGFPEQPTDVADLPAERVAEIEPMCARHQPDPSAYQACLLDLVCAHDVDYGVPIDVGRLEQLAEVFDDTLPAEARVELTDVRPDVGSCLTQCASQADCVVGGVVVGRCASGVCLPTSFNLGTCQIDDHCRVMGITPAGGCQNDAGCGDGQVCLRRIDGVLLAGRCAYRAEGFLCPLTGSGETMAGPIVEVCRNEYVACEGQVCGQCGSDAHCPADRPRCDAGSRCVECLADADCGGGTCDAGRCTCASDADCSGAGGLAHCGADDRCGCLVDAECGSGAPTSIGHCSVDP